MNIFARSCIGTPINCQLHHAFGVGSVQCPVSIHPASGHDLGEGSGPGEELLSHRVWIGGESPVVRSCGHVEGVAWPFAAVTFEPHGVVEAGRKILSDWVEVAGLLAINVLPAGEGLQIPPVPGLPLIGAETEGEALVLFGNCDVGRIFLHDFPDDPGAWVVGILGGAGRTSLG